MTDPENNPLFIRRPTPQQVTAYREAGLFRRLLEKYPEWGEEQGFLTKRERKGILSRFFGGKDASPDVKIDRRKFSEGFRRAQESDYSAARKYMGGRFDRRGVDRPAPARPTRAAAEAAPTLQTDLLSRLTVRATKVPETTSEAAAVLADKASGQAIAEAVEEEVIQEKNYESVKTQQVLEESMTGPPAPESLAKPEKVEAAVRSKGDSSKENKPAKSTSSDSKKNKLDPKLLALKKKINSQVRSKGQWWVMYTKGKSEKPAIIAVLTNVRGKLEGPRYRQILAIVLNKREGNLTGSTEPLGDGFAQAQFRSPKGKFPVYLMRWGFLQRNYAKSPIVRSIVDELLKSDKRVIDSFSLLKNYGLMGKPASGPGQEAISIAAQADKQMEETLIPSPSQVTVGAPGPQIKPSTVGFEEVAATAVGQDVVSADEEIPTEPQPEVPTPAATPGRSGRKSRARRRPGPTAAQAGNPKRRKSGKMKGRR